ncbi:MAG: selenium metabolism-associated LysR family transcriptional regulator [Desulfitobacteriaceae bacterium]|nr:selenium metabolism-associated LysR family transcriptional regulator [Desulfitobacteriaceae bacterium]MDD4751695.1 selenium metabolism-associated LysR family transcriptional regulator [Desulfitobacteriaceae bacterium]
MSGIKQIRAFIMVADLKSFTCAAEALYMTQPAVSSQIKSLEEHLGISLIKRNDKRVELTEAGKQFYLEAKNIIIAYERALEVIDEFRGLKRGRLSIGASTIPGEYIIPRYIGSFHKLYPGIEIRLTVGDTGSVLDMLLARRIDLGIVGAKLDIEKVDFDPFWKDELVLISATDREIPGEISLKDLPRFDFIMREKNSGTRMTLKKIMAGFGMTEKDLRIVMELGSTQAVITAAAADLGVGIVSKWAAREALKAGSIKKVRIKEGELQRELFIVTLKNAMGTGARDSFQEYIKKQTPAF